MKPRFVPVKNKEGLVRDTVSNAIINANDDAWHAYKQAKQLKEKQNLEKQLQKDQINNLQSEVNNIKQELGDMKNILYKILEKING